MLVGEIQADARTRTGDPFITSEVLYQLSYVGEAPTVPGLAGLLVAVSVAVSVPVAVPVAGLVPFVLLLVVAVAG